MSKLDELLGFRGSNYGPKGKPLFFEKEDIHLLPEGICLSDDSVISSDCSLLVKADGIILRMRVDKEYAAYMPAIERTLVKYHFTWMNSKYRDDGKQK